MKEMQKYEIWYRGPNGKSAWRTLHALGDDAAKMKAEVFFNLNPEITRIELFHSRRGTAGSKLLELNR